MITTYTSMHVITELCMICGKGFCVRAYKVYLQAKCEIACDMSILWTKRL